MSMSIDLMLHVNHMLHVYVNAACSYPCCMSIPAVCPCPRPCCMSIIMLHVHVHTTCSCPCPCCMSMSMSILHVHAACPCQFYMTHLLSPVNPPPPTPNGKQLYLKP
jgi:hypothetical protein